jgi:hypothetical protein
MENYKEIGISIYHTTWRCIRKGTDLKLVKLFFYLHKCNEDDFIEVGDHF